MQLYRQIYEFAASAGALEGYVYRRDDLDVEALSNWLGNLKTAYRLIPEEILHAIQPSIDRTLGRAFRSLSLCLGDDHELVKGLWAMVKGPLPASPDEFQKEKWFQGTPKEQKIGH